ncbi:MAG: Asp23/Gls24 family envelope stress response protein [Oscillospiraceae bacterium]|nr:Asp23/Gls24 family envelope stress response protein [Oscillospiraceae bacterium]
MADNRDYISNTDSEGTINISEDVVVSIAALATREVEGISGLSAPTGKDLSELLSGKKNMSKGVRINIDGNSVNLDMYVKVKYGVKIPEAAAALQRAVESSIASMTGLEVECLNIYVVGIDFFGAPGEKAQD